MVSAAVLALLGMDRQRSIGTKLGCLLIQQCLLTYAAAAAIECVLEGHYADGTVRPRLFILADQISLIIPAVMHSIAVVGIITEGVRMPWTRAL